MSRLGAAAALCAALLALPARAGLVFTPHMAEYSRLPAGEYTEGTFVFTEIQNVYDRDGNKVHAGAPFIPDGDEIYASLFLLKMLWIGNPWRDTHVPILSTHPQFCRGIGVLGWQQGSSNVVARDLTANETSGASGLGDFYALCGIYGDDHLWGPLKWNGLFATTVKAPVGRYDTNSLLNTGTHYWTYIPQIAGHAELWGRFIFDGTFAYQINGNNDTPAFGGLTPTRPADVRNFEGNLAYKFTEHWFADVGYSYRESVGPNYYDKYSLNLKDQPVQPQDACDNTSHNNPLGLQVPQDVCNSGSAFFIQPRPGPYADHGTKGVLGGAGIYYIYRTSTVLNARVEIPLEGRGGQIDTIYDIYQATPNQNTGSYDRAPQCTPDPQSTSTPPDCLTTKSRQNTVQEAAAVSASPYFELRLVYLFWAP